MSDAELIERLRRRRDSLDAKAADHIEALTSERDELQLVVDEQGALLADAYGADLDWEEILKQRADHEALRQIETLEAKLAKAEAEAEKYKHAFAAQSRKLQAVLHIEGVKATLAQIKGDKP